MDSISEKPWEFNYGLLKDLIPEKWSKHNVSFRLENLTLEVAH
jgi:hypothetical protein